MRGLWVTVAAVVALVAPAGGAARTTASFDIAGIETAFTSTRGTFVGTAVGDAPAAWKVVVVHTPISTLPASITSGSLTLKTLGTRDVRASFASGSITLVDAGRGCSNQRYRVTADLGGADSGRVDVLLTHYRVSLLGRCVTYAAGVSGTASFGS
jgi:hypothetical protein